MAQSVRLLRDALRRETNDTVSKVAFVDRFLGPEECRSVLELAQGRPATPGRTGKSGKRDAGRDSSVRFLWPEAGTAWLFDKLETALLRLNEGYRFALQGFFEGAQVASYGTGGHYDWHIDLGEAAYSGRKLSMSVQLSDPGDYDGGVLEFLATDERAPRHQGALIVFPSYLVHRITPVTRGERLSLVSWISGPPFR